MKTFWLLAAVFTLFCVVYWLLGVYASLVGQRLAPMPPMPKPYWQQAAEGRAKGLYLEQDAVALDGDCDYWAPCDPENNYTCRLCCGHCRPLSPCILHDRAFAREMERRFSR